MDEVVAKRCAIEEIFPRYAGICLKEIPDATDPKNAGGQHMSEQGSIVGRTHATKPPSKWLLTLQVQSAS